MNIQELKMKRDELEKRARSLKTKSAQLKAWDKVREVNRELYNAFSDMAEKYQGKEVVAEVVHSRDSSDSLAHIIGLGVDVWFSPTSDVKSKSWYNETSCITYEKGQKIKAKLRVDVSSEGLTFILTQVRGGKVDQVRYRELSKNKNLAFFKYPKAKGVTGLFAA
jgi:hypothetical protein